MKRSLARTRLPWFEVDQLGGDDTELGTEPTAK